MQKRVSEIQWSARDISCQAIVSKPGNGCRAVSPDSDFPVAVLNDVTVLARWQTRLEVCGVEGAHGKEANVASAEPEVVGLGLPVLNRFPAALVGELCQNRLSLCS